MAAHEPRWCSPPSEPALSGGEVHVWLASIDQPTPRLHQLAQNLCADERQRADQFRFERDRERFIAGRGVLRAILGRYLGVEPGRVRLGYGPQGKPHLGDEFDSVGLRFNLAHSQGLALYALTLRRAIGIDLESMHPLPDAEQIAARFFSVRERTSYRELPSGQRQEAFYLCWTRKEAYIKAKGEGLSRPLSQFDVSLIPEEPARLLWVGWDPDEASRWSLVTLIPSPGYVASLAVEGHAWDLCFWRYDRSDQASIVQRVS
jgi:4'-phosphopantetheinyl transferase